MQPMEKKRYACSMFLLWAEGGEFEIIRGPELSLSIVSKALEDSFGPGDPSLQQQLDDVVAQLGRCKEVIASLEGEKRLLLQEKEEQCEKAQAAADELAKAQVRF